MTINNFKIDTILKQENIINSTRIIINPAIYPGIFFLAGAIIFKFVGLFSGLEKSNEAAFFVIEAVVFLTGLAITYFSVRDYLNTCLVITDKRIMYKNGITRNISSVPYGKIQELYLTPKKFPFLGNFFYLKLIYKEEKNFINSSLCRLGRLHGKDLHLLEKVIEDINEQFKSESGGKVENIKIESRRNLYIDIITLSAGVLGFILLFI